MAEQAIKNIIPEDWGYDRLRNLCRVFSGYAFKSEDFVSSGIVVVKIGNLQNGTLVIDNRTTYFPENKVSGRHQRFVLHKDDVLIALTGATTGKIAVVPPSFDGALLNQRVGKFEINRDKLNQLFFRFYALTGSFQKEIKDNILQSAQGNVSPQKIESFEILIPRVWEQRKIAYVLYELHRAIAQQEQIIAKTKELKRSLMHRLFTYGLRGEELKETEIGLMPERWKLVSIGELIANKVLFIQNGFPCGKWNDKGIGILQLRPFNISDEGYIDLNAVKHIQTDKKIDSYLLRNEDVIFNNTNSEELVGKTALWQAEKEAVLSNHMTIIRILKKDKVVPLYLARLLHKKWFDKYFRSICQRHVNQASVGIEKIKGVKLGLPSIAEQKEIASVFYQLDQKICNENIKKMNLESFFKSILQLLMTGQVRVKDVDFGEACE